MRLHSEDGAHSVLFYRLGASDFNSCRVKLKLVDKTHKRLDQKVFIIHNDGDPHAGTVKSLEFGSSSVKVAVQGDEEDTPGIYVLEY